MSATSQDRGVSLRNGLLIAAGSAAIGAAAVYGLAASIVARAIVTPPKEHVEDVRVDRVDRDDQGLVITLSATPESRMTGNPGVYSFWFNRDHGHAVIGEIVDQTWDTVTRRVVRVDAGVLDSSVRRGRVNGWVWLNPTDAGFPDYQNVVIDSPVGPNPAWLIPAEGQSDRWMIMVHGRASRRAELLRAVPVAHESGMNSLVISYRNDGEASPSHDHRYGLGDTEWQDVEAAIAYARDHGAEHIVLFGWSMGGAAVLQTIARSKLAELVDGVMLDSPVVDWREALVYQSEAVRLPDQVRRLSMQVLSKAWGRIISHQQQPIEFDRLDWVRNADRLKLPVLLMHSDDDGFVPSGPSREFAASRPDLVTFVPFSKARHCKLWNFDRPLWEGSITTWLKFQHLIPVQQRGSKAASVKSRNSRAHGAQSLTKRSGAARKRQTE